MRFMSPCTQTALFLCVTMDPWIIPSCKCTQRKVFSAAAGYPMTGPPWLCGKFYVSHTSCPVGLHVFGRCVGVSVVKALSEKLGINDSSFEGKVVGNETYTHG